MDTTQRFRPRDANVASEDFDGEFVVLDLGTGKYYSLAGGSAVVWRALMGGYSVDAVLAALPAGDARRSAVVTLVEKLAGLELIVATTDGAAPSVALAGLDSAGTDFGVEVFEDLTELLVADPVHDVDAMAGWPHRPEDKDR